MKFQDYYETLKVSKNATADELKKAYRKLARKYHPDVSKEEDAAQKMARINEAWAVLGDAEKRKAYDEVGAQAWAAGARSGDDIKPPPGWNSGGFGRSHDGFQHMGDAGQFSDFFEQMFGAGAGASAHTGRRPDMHMRGQDRHAHIELNLTDAYHGTEQTISFSDMQIDAQGHLSPQTRTLQVKVPKGVKPGQLIRLAGHGSPGTGGAPAGDLLLEVQFKEDPRWQIDGVDVTQGLRISPWEAALGGPATVTTPDGKTIEVTIPPGSGSGRKLRLKGRGIPARQQAGDLFLLLDVATPGAVTSAQKEAWEQLKKAYPGFDPRRA